MIFHDFLELLILHEKPIFFTNDYYNKLNRIMDFEYGLSNRQFYSHELRLLNVTCLQIICFLCDLNICYPINVTIRDCLKKFKERHQGIDCILNSYNSKRIKICQYEPNNIFVKCRKCNFNDFLKKSDVKDIVEKHQRCV